MLEFPLLRTKRLSVHLREMPIADSIRVASLSPERHEAATTRLLELIVEKADKPTDRHVTDPRRWTVQERALVVGHYIAGVSDAGPNFSIGGGHYVDYLQTSKDYPGDTRPIGVVGDDKWSIVPLTGAAAEAVESAVPELVPEFAGLPIEFLWLIGFMAAQMRLERDTDVPDPCDDVENYSAWLRKRMIVIALYPESDFELLESAFLRGVDEQTHLFSIGLDEAGITILPAEGGGAHLPPTRFPVSACIGESASRFAGKPDPIGGPA